MCNTRLTYFIILLITCSFKGETSDFNSLPIESKLIISRNYQMLESIPKLLSDPGEIKNEEKENIQQECNRNVDKKSINTDIKLELVDAIFSSELLSYKKIFSFIDDNKVDSDFKNTVYLAKMDIYYKIKKRVTCIKKEYEKFLLQISKSQISSQQLYNQEGNLNAILKPLIKESLNIIQIKQDKIIINNFEENIDKIYRKNIFKDHFFNIIIKELKCLMRTVYKRPYKRDSTDY